MTDIVDVYTDAVYDNLRPLRANWAPSQPVQLGDFGTLEGEVFRRLSNVSTLGIDIGKLIKDDLEDQKIFSSASDTSVTFHAAGGTAAGTPITVKASVDISFGSKDSAFFNAAGCSYSMIGDKVALAKKIMTLFDNDTWKREWVVITDLVHSRATTIAISTADNANFVLEASGSVPQVNLADASIGLTVKSARNVGYQIVAEKGLTPLIGLSKVQSSFIWWGNDFKPFSTNIMQNTGLMRTMQDSHFVKSEPREYLQFSQLL